MKQEKLAYVSKPRPQFCMGKEFPRFSANLMLASPSTLSSLLQTTERIFPILLVDSLSAYHLELDMSFRLAAKAILVFSFSIRTGLSFGSSSRIQAPQRLISSTFIYSAPPKDPEALERQREEKRQYQKRWYEKLKENPERYTRVKEANRRSKQNYRAKLKENPEAFEKVRKQRQEYAKDYFVRIKEDPETHKRLKDIWRWRDRKLRAELRANPRTDPAYLEKAKARSEYRKRFHKLRWATNELARKSAKLHVWAISTDRSQVAWSTHMPILTAEKVKHDCATCHDVHDRGYKFWYVTQYP